MSPADAGPSSRQSPLVAFIHRLVVVQPGEMPALLASFATLFCMFSSYTILRPIRDTMGITSGLEKLPYLFWGTFIAMLALQPVYGWLTSRLRRTEFLPAVYAFFTLNLLAFYLWFHLQQDHTWIARAYFIWVSVFNFFIVAVFWSLMADVFTREQAGRMFGFIAAGASTGGLVGPLVASRLAVPLGTINLLLISAVLLGTSLIFMMRVIRWHRQFGIGAPGQEADTRLGGGVLAAFRQVVQSPYLLGIALFVIALSWVTTFLYLEQQAFVKKIFASSDERTRFFSEVDFWVQCSSLLTQTVLFGRLSRWVGHRAMLASVPLLMTVGYAVFALVPVFSVLVGVLAVRRVGEYAITRPCRDSLFTVCTREEKYKAKSLIDTFIYRGGDATSASAYEALTRTVGLGPAGIGWVGAFVSAVWFALALALGKSHQRAGRVAPVAVTSGSA
ncbi:MAG TPA: MFS transporter [Steroidobacteraceae bacterium]|nr:MFS transporter [Steroidobacteraceae bacterium]